MIEILLPLEGRTKKNHMQIGRNKHTGKTFVTQGKYYKQFSNDCSKLLPRNIDTIDYPVNLQAIFYMKTKRKVDLVNLLNAIQDILVDNEILIDDNYQIIVSTDGSRVKYDKENPRIEITITTSND